jgi:hypothetical protein
MTAEDLAWLPYDGTARISLLQHRAVPALRLSAHLHVAEISAQWKHYPLKAVIVARTRHFFALAVISLLLRKGRMSVKGSSGVLMLSRKPLGTSENVQIVNDGTATQIEEILAQSAIASAPSLPPTSMSQSVLNSHAFA